MVVGVVIERAEGGDDVLGAIAAAVAADCVGAIAGREVSFEVLDAGGVEWR